MAKYYGDIGYRVTEEVKPGVWKGTVKTIKYCGDIYKFSSSRSTGESINPNITLNNQISIIADPFAFDNFSNIVYAEVMGSLWEVKTVEVQYPRLVLTLGGVYNGEQA